VPTADREASVRLRSIEEYSALIGSGTANCDRPPGAVLAQALSNAAATKGNKRLAMRCVMQFMIKIRCSG
jgi:hypothetical protein